MVVAAVVMRYAGHCGVGFSVVEPIGKGADHTNGQPLFLSLAPAALENLFATKEAGTISTGPLATTAGLLFRDSRPGHVDISNTSVEHVIRQKLSVAMLIDLYRARIAIRRETDDH